MQNSLQNLKQNGFVRDDSIDKNEFMLKYINKITHFERKNCDARLLLGMTDNVIFSLM